MAQEKPKTLEELAAEVIDTQQGIQSGDDLAAFFRAAEAASTPTMNAVVEPTPAPTPTAPQEPVPAAPTPGPAKVEPPKEEPTLDFLPEKFRGKDVVESVKKMARSYSELEAELKKQKDDTTNMKKLMESLTQRPIETQVPVIGTPQGEEIEDSQFFERPRESITKVAEQVAAQKILQYHVGMERARYVENFRNTHSDFDEMRGDILSVLQSRPDLDKDTSKLPLVYEMAKGMKQRRLEALRTELGMQPTPPVTQPTQQLSQIDIETVKREATQEALRLLREEVQKRSRASGIQGGTPPTSPQTRTQTVTDKPKTYDELVLEEILSSGPRKLSISDELLMKQ